jgi:alpha-ketoglutaric semialdehyde dehydrogenase
MPTVPTDQVKASDVRVAGRSLIAGQESEGPKEGRIGAWFKTANPALGSVLPWDFVAASTQDVDRAAGEAWRAFYGMLAMPSRDRARLLEAIADGITGLGDALVQITSQETGLAVPRVAMERDRTVFTLQMFAGVVRDGGWVEASIDRGDAARKPLPKPDVRRMLRPLGPVAVFGASNFPLAYSTAGGDTASALAAGCPVVVKGHAAHPATGELIARAVCDAVKSTGFPEGTFSYLAAGGSRDVPVGQELVRHPCIRAVGFTGSSAAGISLSRLAAERTDPIPVFAEMGSVNPIFVLPAAAAAQGEAIAEKIATSVINSSGQMCTCPGLVFLVRGAGTDGMVARLADLIAKAPSLVMLSSRVRAGYLRRLAELSAVKGVELRSGSAQAAHGNSVVASAVLLRTTFPVFREHPTLGEECFGPSTIIVECDHENDIAAAAALIQGSLTAGVFAEGTDSKLARHLQSILEHRVGRLVYNGVTTGVEVCTSMVHSGPFPSCNMPHSTAVGMFAIKRWCRPVAYQNAPDTLLPPELQEENPLRIARLINGAIEPAAGTPSNQQ